MLFSARFGDLPEHKNCQVASRGIRKALSGALGIYPLFSLIQILLQERQEMRRRSVAVADHIVLIELRI